MKPRLEKHRGFAWKVSRRLVRVRGWNDRKNKIPSYPAFLPLCSSLCPLQHRWKKKLSRRILLSDEHFFYRCLNRYRNLPPFRQFENPSFPHQIDRLIIYCYYYYYYTNFNLKDIKRNLSNRRLCIREINIKLTLFVNRYINIANITITIKHSKVLPYSHLVNRSEITRRSARWRGKRKSWFINFKSDQVVPSWIGCESAREPFIHHSAEIRELVREPRLRRFPFSRFHFRVSGRAVNRDTPFLRVSTSLAEDTRPFSAAPQGPSLNERLLTPCSQKRARRGVTNGVPAAFWPVECRTTPHAARLIGLVIVSSLGEMKWNESDCRSAFRLARLSYGTCYQRRRFFGRCENFDRI